MDFSFVLFLVIVACALLAGGVSGLHHLRKRLAPTAPRDRWFRGDVSTIKAKAAAAGRR